MSINHLINEQTVPLYDIYVNNLNAKKVISETPYEDLEFKTQNDDIVNLSSLASHGAPSERLTSNGDGTVSWVAGAGTSGIEYSGVVPVASGKLAKYDASDGSLVNETSFVDTDILLKDGSVSMTGNLNLDSNGLFNSKIITGNGVDEIEILNSGGTRIFVSNHRVQATNDIEMQGNIRLESVNNQELDINLEKTVNNIKIPIGSIRSDAVDDMIITSNNKIILNSEVKINNVGLDMNNNDILNTNFLQVKEIVKDAGELAVIFGDDVNMSNFDINNCNEIKVSGISSYSTPDINFNDTLDMNNNEIKNCSNITTTDVNTNTISCITPSPEVKMTCDLNLDGNNIIGLTTLNGIQASGGVYSNTGGFTFSGVTSETDLLSSGASYGTRIIPANSFLAGDIYTLKIGGQITCANNDVFDIRVLSNFGLASQCVFSSFSIQIDGAKVNEFWEIEIDFSLRATGGIGVATITTNGDFNYFSSTAVKKGFGISSVQNTTFNTEIQNDLSITYSTASSSITSFQVDQASLMKFF